MKITWELADIKPGRIIFKPDCGMSGVWMIGYRVNPDDGVPSRAAQPNFYGLVSLADGMFLPVGSGSKEAIVQHLNNVAVYLPVELSEKDIE